MSIAEHELMYGPTNNVERSAAAAAVIRFFQDDRKSEYFRTYALPASEGEHDAFMRDLDLLPATGVALHEAVHLPANHPWNIAYEGVEVYQVKHETLRDDEEYYIIRQENDVSEETGHPSARVTFWARK